MVPPDWLAIIGDINPLLLDDVDAQERHIRLREFGTDDALIGDVELLSHRLVHHSTSHAVGDCIGRASVPSHRDAPVEVLHGLLNSDLRPRQTLLDPTALASGEG
jgi:hypothetical protein